MTREQGQFDESFGAEVLRRPVAPSPTPPVGPHPLTAQELGDLHCRFRSIRIGTGEEILVVLAAEDWQALMDQYGLVITRRA